MNAAQLHSGEFYAWRSNPPKGRLPIDARKVRLRHIEQRKASYEKNRRTLAAITVVDTERQLTVPAREILMFWDEYEPEQKHMLAERAAGERERRRRSLRGQVVQALVNYKMIEKQFPFVVSVYSDGSISIPKDQVLNYFGITNDMIEEALDRAMEENETS